MFGKLACHLYALIWIVFLAIEGLSLTNSTTLPLPEPLQLPQNTTSDVRYARPILEARSVSCKTCDGKYVTVDGDDTGCGLSTDPEANSACLVWQNGNRYCMRESWSLCCHEWMKVGIQCRPATHCAYDWGPNVNDYGVVCMPNDQYACPQANVTCPIGNFCCGTSCGDSSAGDICCTNDSSSSSYVCKSGQQCSANGCISAPSETTQIGDWRAQGCYSDTVDVRTLPNYHATTTGLTVQECVQAAAGYKYAGVEYGYECWFGNELSSITTKQSSGCNMPCSGDSSELCGGNLHINIYLNEAYTLKPTVLPSSGPFKSQGCFADDSNARLLNSGSFTDATGMTVARCVSLAGSSKYAAVEFHSECYWGNNLHQGQVSEDKCDAACAGDPGTLCGGTWAANVYQNENFSPPSVLPSSGNFHSRGCYRDSSKPRLVSSGHTTDYESMTVEKCISLAGPTFKYVAIEYHGECYWGNTLTNAKVAESQCDAACAGDSAHLCGGTWVANVYENSVYKSPEELSREAVRVLLEQYQALMTKLNNDVAVWRQAIQDEPSTNGKRNMIERRSLTVTQAYAIVEEDIAALEAFTGYVGSIRLTGGETVAIEMQPLSYVEATVEGSIASVEELSQYGSVDNLLVAEIAQVAAGAATNAVAAGQVAVAIVSGLGILGLLAAAFAGAVIPGGGNSGGGPGSPGQTTTSTTTTSSQTSSTTTSACTYTPTASIQSRTLFCDDRCLVGTKYDESTLGDGDGADGNLEKRGALEERFVTIKSIQPYCPFSWTDQWIPYPSTNPGLVLDGNGNPTGAEALPIVQFLDMDLVPLNIANGFCSWELQPHAVRQSYTGVGLNEYHTEHVFEKHFVSSFLMWVVAENIADCDHLSLAFWELRNEPDADNSVQDLASQLTWWRAADNEPIDNGIERFHEFFILEKHINLAKTWVLHVGVPTAPSPLGIPAGDYQAVFIKLRTVSLVFQYLSRADVMAAYTSTFNRFQAYL
ncbi:hypothetical protein ONS96_014365 [Cadophora gregata f. sp. sojae]|nr:hypothetical protein ONS96_014365 [Cadophora gregata f. sp. sojae]